MAIKSKVKGNFPKVAMSLFFNLQKLTFIKVAYFSRIRYHTTFQNPKLSVACVAPISQVRESAMLLLMFTGNYEV
jgi:hypothetical protein